MFNELQLLCEQTIGINKDLVEKKSQLEKEISTLETQLRRAYIEVGKLLDKK